ncbi:hypothetical protein [Paraburkholderia fungorum]|uniref:Uncharacterized protein n=1 Tax=Paraburkholderia fungorum TaxID=134537 RepID=A0A420GJH2_9BURK|nr:hypothetical protein [Paraburkholderia fungorum]RKF45390.1 hypothetical protein BCY88_27120 [Paraburkholderia fungorum]
MEGPWGGWRRTGSVCQPGWNALLLPVCIASILDFRLARQFTNSDAFFAFSAIRVLFRQVATTGFERSLAIRANAALQLIVVRASGARAGAGRAVLVLFASRFNVTEGQPRV